MNIIGKFVTHKDFGSGIVKEINGTIIKVDFNGEIKNFQYPLAFEKFLIAADKNVQNSMLEKIAEDQRQEEERKRNNLVSRPQQQTPQRRIKESLQKNVAFKCTYCDGGKSAERVGFAGTCSDAVMRFNVIEQKYVWCSDFECDCRRYLDGEIPRKKVIGPCTESGMLIEWRADAGAYRSGEKRGQPISMKQIRANSLCVFTSRKPNTPESERFIFAVFLAEEAYEGDKQEAGFVVADPEFKIELTRKEAFNFMFWRYYANSNQPSNPKWGSGLFRYLNARVSAQILRDVAKVKKGTADETLANRLLESFCRFNGVDLSGLPEPYGALIR